ncbi:MAG: hypothetical protein R6X32_17775 [Chloroflexota bacterium]
MTDQQQPPFAHEIEAEFARLLDYYGIDWQYEPKTFVLEQDGTGNVKEAFSPDFYLPHEDLFVELTTMRPKLITKKNRKIRRLRQIHPEVNIKLFKRSDLRDLMIKYGLDQQAVAILGTEAQDTDK